MNVPIAMICDDNYIAATGVALSSIISSKQSNTSYTIYMLCASLSAEHEAMFRSFESDSISIVILRVDANRFTSLVKGYETYNCPASPSALLKFELPNILDNKDKVLYLDVDIIVRTDLTELYLTPLENDLVGAIIDTSVLWDGYFQRIDNYFNSGVMLLNLDLMRKENTMNALIESRLEQPAENLMDQPAYNHVCHGRVKFLQLRYNLLSVLLDRHHNQWTVDDINSRFDTSYAYPDEIFDDAAIIHFAGINKPWINPFVRFSQDWYDIYYDLPSCFHTIPDYAGLLSQTHITVSLTSNPERIDYVSEVIDCLLSQSVHADRIALYLVRDQFPGQTNSLPDTLRTYIDDGSILLKWCDLDLKSHNKYFYAMQEFPDDVIITVDDDEYLPETAIEELLLCWLKCPNAISARRTHLITFDINNKVLPYQDWIHDYNLVLQIPSHQLLAVGCSGILYPPHALPATTFDCKAITLTALDADDLWLKANEALNNIPVALATANANLRHIGDSQDSDLLIYDNLQDNKNYTFTYICDYIDYYYNATPLIQDILSSNSDFYNLTGQQPLIDFIKPLRVRANKVPDLIAQLKESNAKRSKFFASRNKLREEKADLSSKLKESNAKRAEFFAQRNKLREEKTELATELRESNAQLKESNAKRAEFFAQRNKLREEKADLTAKLNQAYNDKSELDQKLQNVYQEKIEQDIQIEIQQNTINEMYLELAAIQNSWTYRIGRFFTWPVRKIRAIRSHSN